MSTQTPLTGYERLYGPEMMMRAETIYHMLRNRRSIRDFSPDPVPRDVIETCIRAAATAPNGANRQPWHFVAISDPETKQRIRMAAETEEGAFYDGRATDEWLQALAPLGTDARKPFLETAPWLIAVFAERRTTTGGKNYYVSESVGIATGMLITALHSAGLGTLTHTPAPMTFLSEICGRPDREKPFVLIVTGYPAQGATVPAHALKKKPFSAITTFIE